MGVFNCQGAGWCKVGKKNLIHDENPGMITGVIRAKDVDYLPRVADDTWTGDTVIFSHLGGMFFILDFLIHTTNLIRQGLKFSHSRPYCIKNMLQEKNKTVQST